MGSGIVASWSGGHRPPSRDSDAADPRPDRSGWALINYSKYAKSRASSSEAAIVGRLIQPDRGDFSPEAASELLGLRFGDEDQARMRELSGKAQRGR